MSAMDRWAGKVKNMIAKGTTNLVDCSGDIRRVQSTFNGAADTHDGMPAPEGYGVCSRPPAGLPNITIFPAGDRSGGIVVMIVDNKYRIELGEGDAALYDYRGQKVHLTDAGIVVATPFNLTAEVGGDSTVRTAGTHRVEAARIELHATEYFRFDVAGHGQVWYPTRVDPWTIGAEAGTPYPISPPEIG